jgi:hypothetical protein
MNKPTKTKPWDFKFLAWILRRHGLPGCDAPNFGRRVPTFRPEPVYYILLWRWWQQTPPKHQYSSTKLNGITYSKPYRRDSNVELSSSTTNNWKRADPIDTFEVNHQRGLSKVISILMTVLTVFAPSFRYITPQRSVPNTTKTSAHTLHMTAIQNKQFWNMLTLMSRFHSTPRLPSFGTHPCNGGFPRACSGPILLTNQLHIVQAYQHVRLQLQPTNRPSSVYKIQRLFAWRV